LLSLNKLRSTPALAIAAAALLVSLSGTSVAATRLTNAGSHPASATGTKPLTKSQIERLIASYVTTHHKSLRGPKGHVGKRGKAGPGAIPIVASDTSALIGFKRVATFGAWSLMLGCSGVSGATVDLTGPGTFATTSSESKGDVAGETVVQPATSIGGGFEDSLGGGSQLSVTGFLQSGSTLVQLQFNLAADGTAALENCTIVGTAIPVP
jgi:hypothetical protein